MRPVRSSWNSIFPALNWKPRMLLYCSFSLPIAKSTLTTGSSTAWWWERCSHACLLCTGAVKRTAGRMGQRTADTVPPQKFSKFKGTVGIFWCWFRQVVRLTPPRQDTGSFKSLGKQTFASRKQQQWKKSNHSRVIFAGHLTAKYPELQKQRPVVYRFFSLTSQCWHRTSSQCYCTAPLY